jgi:hypothetical protein
MSKRRLDRTPLIEGYKDNPDFPRGDVANVYRGGEPSNEPFHKDPDGKVWYTDSKGVAIPAVKMTDGDIQTKEKLRQQRVALTFQQARGMDTKAAELVAGSAGLKPRGVIWVDCNMESEWFNKEDETKLMQLAWQTVEDQNKKAVDMENIVQNAPGTSLEVRQEYHARLKLTSNILKQYRMEQRRMKVFSLSPQVQAAMSGIVIDTIAQFSQLSDLEEPDRMRFKDRAISDENDDRTRRLCRVFRRLPSTRNEFCRHTGIILLYTMALQEGSAMTTARLNKVLLNKNRSDLMWTNFVEQNIDEIMEDLEFVWNGSSLEKDEDLSAEIYTFDWYTHMMRNLDASQNETWVPPLRNTAHHMEIDMDALSNDVPEGGEWDIDTNKKKNKTGDGDENKGGGGSIYSNSWHR